MNIQYYGDYCFKITTKPAGRATEDVVIFTDLPGKSTGIRSPFGHADIVLLSHLDPTDDALSGLKDDPVIIHTPGEFAAKGVGILGYPSFRDQNGGVDRGQNTVFVFDSEDVRLAYLGAIGHPLDEKTVERIGDVDILFVPVGGGEALDPKKIDGIIRDIEPKLVIPMHYALSGASISAEGRETFCRETGCKVAEDLPKLNFKKKDLDGKSMEIVFLQKS
ncbi:MAG: MBL fold metallo-hydrolase [Candidatus Moranbacteria bacterium]|nr:MBL fold metallo-hydrolase [Candidatus Moranbacteria bacterium]